MDYSVVGGLNKLLVAVDCEETLDFLLLLKIDNFPLDTFDLT